MYQPYHMNKYFKMTFLVLLSLSNICYSQSNQDVLDRLDEIQIERDIQRRIEQNRKSQLSTQSNNSESYRKDINQPYINTMTDLEIRYNSKYFNLNISEYLQRDEIGNTLCKNISNFYSYKYCYYSKMLNISMREVQMKDSKIKEKCLSITNESSKKKCMRDILVFGK